MDFLEFLKYGAIGISLALAILSYRLLAREQGRAEVRNTMLTSIMWYMGFALTLSIFFGLSELYLRSSNDRSVVIDEIWSENYGEYDDSTYAQKVNRIKENAGTCSKYDELYSEHNSLNDRYDSCISELGNESANNITRPVSEMNNLFLKHERRWFYLKDLDYIGADEQIAEFFDIINRILIGLGPYSESNDSKDEIASNWAAFIEPHYGLRANLDKDPHYHIQESDMVIILREYVDSR